MKYNRSANPNAGRENAVLAGQLCLFVSGVLDLLQSGKLVSSVLKTEVRVGVERDGDVGMTVDRYRCRSAAPADTLRDGFPIRRPSVLPALPAPAADNLRPACRSGHSSNSVS